VSRPDRAGEGRCKIRGRGRDLPLHGAGEHRRRQEILPLAAVWCQCTPSPEGPPRGDRLALPGCPAGRSVWHLAVTAAVLEGVGHGVPRRSRRIRSRRLSWATNRASSRCSAAKVGQKHQHRPSRPER
jgi:hypothetical protein